MNVLILNCSPVKTGATAEIVRIAAQSLAQRHTVKAVCIDDYSVSLCRGCRSCHPTARCILQDGAQQLMGEFQWADAILAVSPSYWADVPGQFKAFIDRCTPWCNTHEPHATLSPGKRGYAIALRTGPGTAECERIVQTLRHFYGHLEIQCAGSLSLPSVSCKEEVAPRIPEILALCQGI